MNQAITQIGFIGLGNMGSGMARNLLAYCQPRGVAFAVYDLNADAVAALVAKGAVEADSIQALAIHSNVVFTSLPSSKEINQVALGDSGLLNNLPEGAVWFETSTNELAQWQVLVDQAQASLTLIDAPVTGGSEGAAAGTLTMLMGAEQTLVDDYAELLGSFTAKAVCMGPAGSGYVAKLCQLHLNYLVAQGIGETLMLGAKAQLNLSALHHVLQHSCAQSYVVDEYIPKVLDGSYDPSFKLGLAEKDMRLINQLGEHLNVEMPLAHEVYQNYQAATERYGFDEPHLSIVRLIEEANQQLLRAD